MGKKHSSFNMGNGLNGIGEKRYLKANERGSHTPLPQANVRISPDYKDCLHKVIGSMPKWIDPVAADDVTKAMLGACTAVNQVIVDEDEEGTRYVIKFKFIGNGLTTGSFSCCQSESGASTPRWTDYFCIITQGTMNMREEIPDGTILAKLQSGDALQVNEAETDYDDKSRNGSTLVDESDVSIC